MEVSYAPCKDELLIRNSQLKFFFFFWRNIVYTSTRYLCTCTAFSNRKSEEKKKHACIYGFCQIQKVKSGKTQIGILVGRQSTSPPGTSPFGFWYPEDWRNSVLSAPRYPVDWRDSVLLPPQVPCGLSGLSRFSPPGTLWTESSKMTRTGESLLTESRRLLLLLWRPLLDSVVQSATINAILW